MSTNQKIHKALFSCNRIELPKSVQRKHATDKNHSGVTIDVFNATDNSTFGTLYLGQGGISWRSKHFPKSRRLSWTEVAAMLDNRLANRKPS
jgi:hypothetical protein